MTDDIKALRGLIEGAHNYLLGVRANGAKDHIHHAMEALKDAALIVERMERAQRGAV
jgi:hypothetical protein